MVEDGDGLPRLRSLDGLRAARSFRAEAKGAIVAMVEVDLPGRGLLIRGK